MPARQRRPRRSNPHRPDAWRRWLPAGVLLLTGGCHAEPAQTPLTPSALRSEVHAPVSPEAPAVELPGSQFRMLGPESGFVFERYDDIRGQHRILEANGGGVAVFDGDNDGWLDVFMTNGCELPLSRGDRRTHGELFRNLGHLRFEKSSTTSRLIPFGYTTGCATGDFDADGFDDLYVAALGPDALWHNNGDGTFSETTSILGRSMNEWSTSAAFADINGDGHLDLYVVNYLDASDETPKLCPQPKSPDGFEQCPPAMFNGVDDVLLLSDGAGRFVDISESAGIAGTGGNGLGVVITDLDGDRQPEIYVANDGEPNFLFVREPDDTSASNETPGALRFKEQAMTRGVALSEAGNAQASMGVTVGDCDGNGTLDLFLTNFFGDTATLYLNRGGLVFEDATRACGLRAPSRDKLGFGTVFFDVNNDGWMDLFVANGHVDDRTWSGHGEPYRMPPQLFLNNRNGRFVEVSDSAGPYFQGLWLGRGVSTGDLDRDGRIDLVVSHQRAPSVVLRNETSTAAGSLTLRLIGTESNRNGYGARIRLTGQGREIVRELSSGGSFQSGLSAEIHLVLPDETGHEIRILWPSGRIDSRTSQSGVMLTVVERKE